MTDVDQVLNELMRDRGSIWEDNSVPGYTYLSIRNINPTISFSSSASHSNPFYTVSSPAPRLPVVHLQVEMEGYTIFERDVVGLFVEIGKYLLAHGYDKLPELEGER
jgi:hypothetical protein